MNTTTLSPKFQVMIPKKVREEMKLKAGAKFVVFSYDDRVMMVPEKSAKDIRGIAKGVDLDFEREPDRLTEWL